MYDIKKVRCFGAKNEHLRDIGVVKEVTVYVNGAMKVEERMSVTIYNENTQTWQTYEMLEIPTLCPVCNQAMIVQIIAGTTWFAVCGYECNAEFNARVRELGTVEDAVEYYIQLRMARQQEAS